MNNGLYGYADVGRFGLAHSLLAWARCVIWCRDNHIPMIAPNWRHFRIGPWLRGERDNRLYHRLFQFKYYIKGVDRMWLLSTQKSWSAESFNPGSLIDKNENGIVVFKNLYTLNEESFFHQIIGRGSQLLDELERITRPEFRPLIDSQPFIALHVRMGDFNDGCLVEELRAGKKNSRLPISWYCNILKGLRKRVGQVRAVVVSDGSDSQLAEILNLPDVSRTPAQPSISDLLTIAKSAALISSGSGFSMWGSFLGEVPRVCFPGQRLIRVFGDPVDFDCEPEVEDASHLNDDFILSVMRKIDKQRDQLVCS